MQTTQGFQLIKEQKIKELNIYARLYHHLKTGAEVLSLSNDDENKVFGVAFRTPPRDSTGIAHILEHSVLCGSRKYPVKEPFVELLKGSLKTFLNAFTFPDKTCYPVASQNIQDFYNLIDVYLDAVFYPRLTPQIFQQEGWHFELTNLEAPLTYKGVVFNEMKGAYSSPDNSLSEHSLQSLFPDNPYGVDSGGDPKHIPDLTFEKFQRFHQQHYHPANARFFFYGDDDPEDRLKLLEGYFKDFGPLKVDSNIHLQVPFQKSRRIVRPFMVGEGKKDDLRGMITLNWMLTESTDVTTNFALRILNYILLGMPASPLRKALIDSGLGEDITGEGLGTELRQLYFSTGLKGIRVETADRVETLILETLRHLAEKGIDPKTVEAALNTVEFRLRENNTGSFPKGLSLMLRCLTTWLYEGDPLALLSFETPLKMIKTAVRSKDPLFEKMLHRLFVNNPHRTTLILTPDPELEQKESALEQQRLTTAKNAMDHDNLARVLEETRTLKHMQETPDSTEDLATIPVLQLEDLDKKNKVIPITSQNKQGTQILFHDLLTNGIVYFDLGFNLHALSDKYLPYAPLFGRALVEMGTDKEDFVSLMQRINRKTGGIRPHTLNAAVKNQSKGASWLFLRGKAMQHQATDLMNIMRDVLLGVRLDNQQRFRQMVLEAKARVEQKIIPNGHEMVNARLRAHFSEAHWATEQMAGISYLFFLRELAETVDNNWEEVLQTLREIHRVLINRNAAVINITMPNRDLTAVQPPMEALLKSLPAKEAVDQIWNRHSPPII